MGRLAPSPTGYLHLGNAWSFLWAWLWTRSQGGSMVLRMEDIDPHRARPMYAKAIEDDLHWLGLDWDGTTVLQSSRYNEYLSAIHTLEQAGHIYPCYCTRKELRSLAGAPHVEDMGAPYLGACANLSLAERKQKVAQGRQAALRIRCSAEKNIEFIDEIYGMQSFDLQQCGGDFAIRRSDGVFAYQLAVVLDDAEQGVTHVLRGADILTSTPRQILLCNLLGLHIPNYAHVPLLLDEYGERLAKRHASLGLGALRENGVKPERIVALLAYLAGLRSEVQNVSAHQLLENFSLTQCRNLIKKKNIIVHAEHINCLLV